MKTCLGKPHSIILRNDRDLEFKELVQKIRRSMHCCTAEAFHLAGVATENGSVIVRTGSLEQCELVEEQLGGASLEVSIIPELNSED